MLLHSPTTMRCKYSYGRGTLLFRFIEIAFDPPHGDLLPDPALVLHRRNHFHLLPAERGDHLIIDRAIRVEASQSIEIEGKVFGLIDVGNLIFQGELFKLRFCTPAIPSFRSIISSIKKSAHRHNGDEREFLFTSHNSEHLPIQFLFSFSSAGKLLLLSPC